MLIFFLDKFGIHVAGKRKTLFPFFFSSFPPPILPSHVHGIVKEKERKKKEKREKIEREEEEKVEKGR